VRSVFADSSERERVGVASGLWFPAAPTLGFLVRQESTSKCRIQLLDRNSCIPKAQFVEQSVEALEYLSTENKGGQTMIRKVRLLRNIGQFDSVDSGSDIPLSHVTLVYAENGRGKTTLAAILRSLATGDPNWVNERRRLSAQYPPHVVLECGDSSTAIFENSSWSRTDLNIAVFDDLFVDQNVYSGLSVEPGHRQHMHDLILGAQGVALNRKLQKLVDKIEEHNRALRRKATAISPEHRGTLPVDAFCELEPQENIDEVLQTMEGYAAAARDQGSVKETPPFNLLTLPPFDESSISQVLEQSLPDVDASALARVQDHLATLGARAESWVAEGMRYAQHVATETSSICPFCGQDLLDSPVLTHYRTYFSNAYGELKETVTRARMALEDTHDHNASVSFERAVGVMYDRQRFWSQFCEIPHASIDTETIVKDWRVAFDMVKAALEAKAMAPLDPMMLSHDATAALAVYESHRMAIAKANAMLSRANAAIAEVKQQAVASDPQSLASTVTRLKATKSRYEPEVAKLCDDYLAEKAAKAKTEQQRDDTRAKLDTYRETIFPKYEEAINLYLERFNAGCRLRNVAPRNTRSGSTCSYSLAIEDKSVAVAGGTDVPGQPSFRSTLSSGDRNALALAFFFASLDEDPALKDKIVLIDDPVSSMDEHRSLTTIQEIRRLAERVAQVILLSHRKPFLCGVWEGADKTGCTAIQIKRSGSGSTIETWSIGDASVTENDRLRTLLRAYLDNGSGDRRQVAQSIRPVLEAFLRVAYSEHFPPGKLIGQFLTDCRDRINQARPILDQEDFDELRDLNEYSRAFHHETGAAFATEPINDMQLKAYVKRVLAFTRRK